MVVRFIALLLYFGVLDSGATRNLFSQTLIYPRTTLVQISFLFWFWMGLGCAPSLWHGGWLKSVQHIVSCTHFPWRLTPYFLMHRPFLVLIRFFCSTENWAHWTSPSPSALRCSCYVCVSQCVVVGGPLLRPMVAVCNTCSTRLICRCYTLNWLLCRFREAIMHGNSRYVAASLVDEPQAMEIFVYLSYWSVGAIWCMLRVTRSA